MTTQKPSPRIAILSDLHLSHHRDFRTQAFEKLLSQWTQEGLTELWLLGDILDLFVGSYSFWRQQHQTLFNELQKLKGSGCRILWLEGNHDFHMRSLLTELGIDVQDGVIDRRIGTSQRRVYLAHGDLVNSEDQAYLRWRATTRSPRFRGVLDRVPSWLAEHLLLPLAQSLSRSSRRRDRDTIDEIQERYRHFASSLFTEGYQAVFLGHCHVEDLFIEPTQQQSFYLNLGSWLDGSQRYALWMPDQDLFPNLHSYPKIEE